MELKGHMSHMKSLVIRTVLSALGFSWSVSIFFNSQNTKELSKIRNS